jgi:putative spermidine/putrescine transport system permease protein
MKKHNRRYEKIFPFLKGAVLGLIFSFVLAPILIIVITSFTESSILTWPPQGFSFRWFFSYFHSPVFIRASIVSIQLALISSLVSLSMGFGAAYALDRYNFSGKNFVETLLTSSLMVPLIIIGIALLQFFAFLKIGLSLFALVVGHVIICMPYVVKTMRASLLVFDRSVEEAAVSLGARPCQVLRRITLPMLKSGIFSSVVFSFIYSFNNLSVSLFLAGPRLAPLPVEVFTAIESSADPTVNAISTVIIGATFAIVVLVQKATGFERFM